MAEPVAEYVAGFLFNPDRSQVAMVRKNRPSWQAGMLNGIGGKLEFNERWDEAMAREFEEETGVSIPPEDWQHVVTLYRRDVFWLKIYRAFSDKISDVKTVTDEQILISPIRERRLVLSPALQNLSWLIPMILDEDLRFPLELQEKP